MFLHDAKSRAWFRVEVRCAQRLWPSVLAMLPWFDPGRSVLRRILVAMLIFFAGGTYMYVWCELFRPRWYEGRLSRRYGLLVCASVREALGQP